MHDANTTLITVATIAGFVVILLAVAALNGIEAMALVVLTAAIAFGLKEILLTTWEIYDSRKTTNRKAATKEPIT